MSASFLLLGGSFLFAATPASAGDCQWNGSYVNCLKDDKVPNNKPANYPTCDSLKGFCINQKCRCGEPDPGVCHDALGYGDWSLDLCPTLPYCPWGGADFQCGPVKVSGGGGHIDVTSCRCIQKYPGGCHSYCDQVPPACATIGNKCTSDPNICGMTNEGSVNGSCVCDAVKPDDNLCHTPVGFLEANPPYDSITLQQMCTELRGWALDTDYSGSIPVEVWDNGVLIRSLTANASRPDVAVSYPGHELSGYSFSTTGLTRGVPHEIQVFGIDVDIYGNRTAGPHPQLNNSPLTLTCPPPPTATLSAQQLSVSYGGTTSLFWTSANASACTLTVPGGAVLPVGTAMAFPPGLSTGPLTSTSTYTLTCINDLGSVTSPVTISVNVPPPTAVISSVEFTSACNDPSPDGWFSWTYTSNEGIPADKYIYQIDTDQNEANGVVLTSTEQSIARAPDSAPVADTDVTTPRLGIFARLVSGIRMLAARIRSHQAQAPSLATAEAGFCDPFQNCFNDGDCSQGYCRNRVCQCDAPVPDICADRCPDRGLCYPGQCGGNTVHIQDCRGISSGGRGGVISYCDQPPVPPPPVSGVTLKANPSSIPAGGVSQLAWSSTGATSCSSDAGTPVWDAFTPGTSGTFGVNGLATTTSFGITCTGPGGSASDTAVVTVQAPTTPPPSTPTPTPVPGTPTSAVYSRALPANLLFGTQYYIRIRAKGTLTAMGAWSPYAAFGPAKKPPAVSFSYVPFPPVAEQDITFSDDNDDSAYTGSPERLWDFHDGNTISDVSTVTKVFPADGTFTVTLQVTDDNGTCWDTKNVSVNPALPRYREVRPGPR